MCAIQQLHARCKDTHGRRLRIESLEDRRVLATLVVTDLGDDTLASLAGDGQLSLREAIEAVNIGAPVDGIAPVAGEFGTDDTILFSAARFLGSPRIISLTAGQFELTSSMTIAGPPGNLLTIDAQESSRIFDITATEGDFTFEQLTLTGGLTTGLGQQGGALRSMSTGQLNVFDTNIVGNRTTGNFASGGGVWTMGYALFRDSTVADNRTEGTGAGGGGVFSLNGVDFDGSAVANNRTMGGFSSGGGVSASGRVGLSDTTVSGNQTLGAGSSAGGVLGIDEVSVNQSTISGNETSDATATGAGISSEGPVTIDFSTIVNNNATGANSVGGGVRTTSTDITVRSSIIANNTAGSSNDVTPGTGTLTVEFSLIGDTTGLTVPAATNLLDQDPMLAPLAGVGRIQTHAPMSGSPVIDAGDPTPPFIAVFDQRGEPFQRVVDGDGNGDGVVDMGAHELQVPVADFNSNGAVNGHDFLVWQRGFGLASASVEDGDSDSDGDVDAQDLFNWREQYSQVVGGVTGAGALGAVLGIDFGETGADADTLVSGLPPVIAAESVRDQAFSEAAAASSRDTDDESIKDGGRSLASVDAALEDDLVVELL